MTRHLTAVLLLAAALSACGRRGELRSPSDKPPPVPYGQAQPSTTNQGLRPPPEEGPARVDDVINRPERERAPDPFDLPPPGVRR